MPAHRVGNFVAEPRWRFKWAKSVLPSVDASLPHIAPNNGRNLRISTAETAFARRKEHRPARRLSQERGGHRIAKPREQSAWRPTQTA